jgi:hypothetical protein
VLALVVQAADQIADAMFPGDMVLTPLNRLSEEFHTAWSHLRSDPDAIMAEARRIVAELTTEMAYMFPGSVENAGYYSQKPLNRLVYAAPGHRKLDVIQTFFEVRTSALEVIDQVGKGPESETAPMVVNLAHLPDVSSQVEALTSLMATGVMKKRRGIVVVSGDLNPVYRNFITGAWNMITLPTTPALWIPWLADESGADDATNTAGEQTEQPSLAT